MSPSGNCAHSDWTDTPRNGTRADAGAAPSNIPPAASATAIARAQSPSLELFA
jgi:hypothetical protein